MHVGVCYFSPSAIKWTPRVEQASLNKIIPIETILRASWAPIGKMCHCRIFCKAGEKVRLDGFKRSDIDFLVSFFSEKEIEFERETIASGGGNYGTLDFEGNM